jgi:hypothetical protein
MPRFTVSDHLKIIRQPGDILVAKEFMNHGRCFSTFLSPNDLYKYINAIDGTSRCFYECITDGIRRGYWDLDIKPDKVESSRTFYQVIEPDTQFTTAKLAEKMMYEMYQRVYNALLVYKRDAILYICESCKDGVKYSYHFISPNVYFPDNATLHAFTKTINDDVNLPFIQLLDITVYGAVQQFRLTRCHKQGDYRPKNILSEGCNFSDTIITYVANNDVFVMPAQARARQHNKEYKKMVRESKNSLGILLQKHHW